MSNKRNSGRTTRMLLMALSRAGEARTVYIVFAIRREKVKGSSWFRYIAKQVGMKLEGVSRPMVDHLVIHGTEYYFFYGAYPSYDEDVGDVELFIDHSVADAKDALVPHEPVGLQHCKNKKCGRLYSAKSHEYPCPFCTPPDPPAPKHLEFEGRDFMDSPKDGLTPAVEQIRNINREIDYIKRLLLERFGE